MDRQTYASGPGGEDMYSTAYNFYSHISANVDTRTGTYTASVELTTGEGNLLRGPHFVFRLVFNPFSARNDGVGAGWELDVSRMDREPTITLLSVGGGEVHRVETLDGGQPARFPDRKLDSFRMTPSADSSTATIEHVTGMVEELRSVVGEPGRVLRLHRIAQPNGDALELKWAIPPSTGIVSLVSVVDADQTELLNIQYPNSRDIVLTLRRGGGDSLELHFMREGPLLTRISMPTLYALNARTVAAEEQASWEFGYTQIGSPPLTLLRSVTTPNGVIETVTYDQDGLTLPPRGPRATVPCVDGKIQRLASNPAVVLTSHQYSFDRNQNHYGNGVVGDWQDRTDQLLHMPLGRYDYGSREIQLGDNGGYAVIRDRIYNHFHLMVRETTRRGKVVQEIETIYGELPGLSFEDQPKALQLPHAVITRRWHLDAPDAVAVSRTDTDYDAFGNVVRTSDSTSGIVEVSDYYPPEGESIGDEVLCPRDPLGMVRRLKSRTVKPGPGGGHERRVSYRYCEVDVLASPIEGEQARDVYVQACAEVEEVAEDGLWRTLSDSRQGFIDDHGDQHGCVRAEMKTVDGLNEYRDYEYSIDPERTQRTRVVTHTVDNGTDRYGMPRRIVNRWSETERLIDGLVTETVDAAGNRSVTAFDALGRRIRETLHPGDVDYETSSHWRYMLSRSERWIERTGVTGLKHRQWFDTAGRPIRSDEPLADGGSYQALQQSYDTLGQCTMDVVTDPMTDAPDIVLTTAYAYDDWGRCARTSLPDGSRVVTETMLVDLPDQDGNARIVERVRQWQEEETGVRPAGWSATYTDAAGRKIRAEAGTWVPGSGADDPPVPEPVAVQSWLYDGLGRCVVSIDAMENRTEQIWDARDRVTGTLLPDGTLITREFALGHEGELVARLAVTPKDGDTIELGRRSWDGLGRVELEQAGSLVYQLAYVPGQISPATRTLPGGGVLHMEYDRRLGEVLLDLSLEEPVTGRTPGKRATMGRLQRGALP